MCERAHATVLFIDDATTLHVGQVGSFKIPGAIMYFCLRVYPHMCDPGTRKCQPYCG